jgi:RNA polymerase sigma-70 factor (ECF subfamily)
MRPASPQDDQERRWIRAIAACDRDAFERLFRTYETRLLRYFLRLVRDRRNAEELTSDVLLEVWKRADGFRGDSRPSTWIFGIAHHKGVSALRRRRPESAGVEAASEIEDPAPSPEDRAVGAEGWRRLKEVMATLSPEHREVLELFYAGGLSVREVAAVQGCPESTAKTRLFYARKRLRPLFDDSGGAPA